MAEKSTLQGSRPYGFWGGPNQFLDKNLTQRSASFSSPHSKQINHTEIETLKQENKILRNELEQLKIAMNKAQKEIHRLTAELKQKTPTYCEREYYTDEEELVREAEWILKGDKKRKVEQSPEMSELEKNTSKRKPGLNDKEMDWILPKYKN